jgi:Holliday junction resolvase RusA-like endonuclease
MEFSLKFWLPGPVVPKPRPRVTIHGAYLPKRYREWRQVTEGEILLQMGDRMELPIFDPVSVEVVLQGKHRSTIDLDNAAGAILDSLVAAKVLLDDRLIYVGRLVVEHRPNGELGAWVGIKNL